MPIYADTESTGEGLVWGSEVTIEIVSQISKHTSIDNSSLLSRVSTDTDSVFKVADKVDYSDSKVPQLRIDTPHSMEGDADDEGSLRVQSPCTEDDLPPLIDIRGRPRSRTKQLRRRGIDLSRDELRISSRWSSGEKRSMEDFRDAIREKANGVEGSDNVWIRWAEKRNPFLHEVGLIKTRVAKSLRRSGSRGRSRKSERIIEEDGQSKSDLLEHQDIPLPVQSTPHEMVLRRVQSSVSLPKWSSPPSSEESRAFTKVPAYPSAALPVKQSDRQASWRTHLNHDLQPYAANNRSLRRKKGRYILQQSSSTKQARPPLKSQNQFKNPLVPDYFTDYCLRNSSSTIPLLQPSLESRQDIATYHRLPSLALSTDSTSTNVSTFMTAQPQRVNTIDIPTSNNLAQPQQENTKPTTYPIFNINQNPNNVTSPQTPTLSTFPLQPNQLKPSKSLPESLLSRFSSLTFADEDEIENDNDVAGDARLLALHPLAMRLPHENLVRASIGVGLRRWD